MTHHPITNAPASKLRPMHIIESVILFACSALVFWLGVYILLPGLLTAGVVPFWAFLFSYSVVLALMMVAALFGVKKEGYPLNLETFRQRLRFQSLSGKDWLRTVGLFVVGFLATAPLIPTAKMIASLSWFSPASFLPDAVNPLKPLAGPLVHFMGVPLAGNWWVAVAYFIFLTCFNILGEEIWFRGYILPRQELTHGKWTWLIHGGLWALFHVPVYPWYLFYIIPTAMTVTFAAQRAKSTWASYLVHFIGNGLLAMLPIISGIMTGVS